MQKIVLGDSGLVSSRLVYGCMRISGDNSSADREKGKVAIRTAIEAGYTHFDHADIYGAGACESIFSEVLVEEPGLREKLLISSKCGIRLSGDPGDDDPKRYDFSRQYIIDSVDGILRRLGIEYLDLFLLHRPDFLFNPEEVAGTFDILAQSGKVRNFGVSNFRSSQFSMLQSRCSMPLLVNQIEVNIDNVDAITEGTLDQCQELNISPLAWCPLGGVVYPAWGAQLSSEQSGRVQNELALQAKKYQSEPWVVMLAWLLKHPSNILPIVGSTRPDRIRQSLQSLGLNYSRSDWYRLIEARNGREVA